MNISPNCDDNRNILSDKYGKWCIINNMLYRYDLNDTLIMNSFYTEEYGTIGQYTQTEFLLTNGFRILYTIQKKQEDDTIIYTLLIIMGLHRKTFRYIYHI